MEEQNPYLNERMKRKTTKPAVFPSTLRATLLVLMGFTVCVHRLVDHPRKLNQRRSQGDMLLVPLVEIVRNVGNEVADDIGFPAREID